MGISVNKNVFVTEIYPQNIRLWSIWQQIQIKDNVKTVAICRPILLVTNYGGKLSPKFGVKIIVNLSRNKISMTND